MSILTILLAILALIVAILALGVAITARVEGDGADEEAERMRRQLREWREELDCRYSLRLSEPQWCPELEGGPRARTTQEAPQP